MHEQQLPHALRCSRDPVAASRHNDARSTWNRSEGSFGQATISQWTRPNAQRTKTAERDPTLR
jgi:hypothetical protein